MDLTTYNINVAGKKTSIGDIDIKIKKNDAAENIGSVPFESDMAIVLIATNYLFTIYGNDCYEMTSFPDELKISPEMDNINYLFSYFAKMEHIDTHLFDTSRCKEMAMVFNGCAALKEVDLRHWNVSNVENMEGMFSYCSSLETVDLTGWDTKNVKNMNNMFIACSNLREIKGIIDISNAAQQWCNTFAYCDKLQGLKITGVPEGYDIEENMGLHPGQYEIIA